jgi:hypothetical protein
MAWTDVPIFTGSEITSAVMNTYLRDNLLAQGESQRCIWLDPTIDRDSSTGFGVTTDVAAPNDPYGCGLSGGAGAIVTFREYLTAGKWTINLHTAQRDDYGTISLFILDDDFSELSDVGEFNCYTSNSVAQFTLGTPLEFDVKNPGIKTIQFQVSGKDPNSNGSTVRLFGVMLQKTEDATPKGTWTFPRTWGADDMSSAAMETHIRNNLQVSGPARRRQYLDLFTTAAQSAVGLVADSTHPLGFFLNCVAQNAFWEYDVVLPVGTVTVTASGLTGPAGGRTHVLWDGVDQGFLDWYTAFPLQNFRPSVQFTVTTPKKAKLRFVNSTKATASSGYQSQVSRVALFINNDAWTDPVHQKARDLATVDQWNDQTWRRQMRMRAEMPWLIDIDPLTPPTAQNEWSTYAKNDAHYYFCAMQTNSGTRPGKDGYWIEWSVALAAGTYAISLVGAQSTFAGLMDLLLDDVAKITGADFYHATASSSKIVTQTGVIIPDTKAYRVRVRVNGHNASAKGRQGGLNRIRFRRTA